MTRRIKTEDGLPDLNSPDPQRRPANRVFFGDAAPQAGRARSRERRVEKIRELAAEENVCLADVYAVWELARENKCPWEELLANKVNHPGIEGHEVYAEVLMKLFE